MADNYITVAAFAKKQGISIFDVYKMSSKGEIETTEKDGICYVITPEPEHSAAEPSPDRAEERTSELRQQVEALTADNAELRRQLEEKNQIIADFALRFADLAQQSQQITTQTQILQAVSEKKQGFFKRLLSKK